MVVALGCRRLTARDHCLSRRESRSKFTHQHTGQRSPGGRSSRRLFSPARESADPLLGKGTPARVIDTYCRLTAGNSSGLRSRAIGVHKPLTGSSRNIGRPRAGRMGSSPTITVMLSKVTRVPSMVNVTTVCRLMAL